MGKSHHGGLQEPINKFNFSNRTIPIWNSLPDYVVASPTINTFKARLDKFWENQEVRYNWKVDISFTRSRSKVELTIGQLWMPAQRSLSEVHVMFCG